MADTTYKRLDSDQLIFLVQYLFTKLKGSSLADNTTYTLEKSGANVILKDGDGNTVSTLENVGVTYSDVTAEASGLMSPTMLETLNNLKSFSEGGIATVKVNGTALTITNNTVDITVPTNVSDLTNDSGYQTAANVKSTVEGYGYQTEANVKSTVEGYGYQTAANVKSTIEGYGYQTAANVSAAIENASHLTKSIVTALPSVSDAKENIIYLILSSSSTATNNIYDEYLLINGAFEKIGDTNLDLSGYVQSSQMATLTNTEITTIVDNAYNDVFTS